MNVLEEGGGPLFQSPDPDGNRTFFEAKNRALADKRMTAARVVERFIPDGSYLAAGGFGTNRIPTEILHEILRARRKGLGFWDTPRPMILRFCVRATVWPGSMQPISWGSRRVGCRQRRGG